MLLKKWTGILFIFTANIFLLAHNIVPHHHHDGIPHFVFSDCCSHHHDDDCCNHGENGACLFEQNIDAVYENGKEDCDCASCTALQHSGMLLQAVLLTFTYDFSLVRETDFSLDPPYLINYYSDYLNQGLGLRAPPISLG
ncbi:MAG: hypothetical protein LBT25_01000 [Candidatus Symbiothrix sp.]|jgi:hypothetical protein|nr:hypothetical protein [Candidatus Symbiothrix sp.]